MSFSRPNRDWLSAWGGRRSFTSNFAEAYGFVRSRADLELPDLELLFAPAPLFDDPSGHAVTLVAILLKPLSRGSVSLRSPNPKDKPIIDPGYLTDEGGVDRATMMTGLRMCATIARSPALKDVLGTITRPRGAQDLSDRTLEEALNTSSRTIYHPVGTCRMAAMPPAWCTRSCGFTVSPGCGWRTRR